MDMETVKRALRQAVLLLFCLPLPAQLQTNRDTTTFVHTTWRATASWQPAAGLGAQAVLLSHADDTFLHRAKSWREKNFRIHFLLGANQGNYQDYVAGLWDGRPHEDWQRNESRDYFFPAKPFIAYLKSKITHGIDCGAEAIYLEHPVFLPGADSSTSFKNSWRERLKNDWQNPSGAVEWRYAAGKLQQRLYWEAIVDLFAHAKQYAQEKNREVKCYLATRSLFDDARLGFVGPATRALHIPDCDGVLAEIDREAMLAPTVYSNVRAARPFETAFLHYGWFANQVRGHGKQLWLRLDLFGGEDGALPENGRLYRAQIVAALFYPEHRRFELPPVPEFLLAEARNQNTAWQQQPTLLSGKTAAAADSGRTAAALPAISAQTILAVNYALKGMTQKNVVYEAAERGVGIFVSDAMLLQRAAPAASDSSLSFFYGLALPLLKHGVFVQPLALENVHQPQYLTGYKVIFLSYRFMQPQDYEWHERLTTWVRAGGTLIFIDDGNDPFNQVKDWWRKGMFDYTNPAEHLFETLKLGYWPKPGRNQVGMGSFIYLAEDPSAFARKSTSAAQLLELVNAALPAGRTIQTQNYLRLRRGPYVIAATFAETADTSAQRLQGNFIDLLDARLPHLQQAAIAPGEQALLYDLSKIDSAQAQVVSVSGVVSQEQCSKNEYAFSVNGLAGIITRVLVFAPAANVKVQASSSGKPVKVMSRNEGRLYWVEFESTVEGVEVKMVWETPALGQETTTK